jgi:thiamine kinase-like enzyme
MNELDVKKRFEAIFPCHNATVEHRLLGGMSNYTFVIKADGELYTYRIPGEFAEYFVDRKIEKANIKLIDQLNISNETIYLNTDTGEKIAKYIPGQSLHQVEVFEYEKISQLLKKIHNSGLIAANDYEPFTRLEKYEFYVKVLGFIHPQAYLEIKERFLKFKAYLLSQKKVLCHGDSQPSNFILDKDTLYSVDFEFVGNNDLFYDLACFANIKLEHGLNLLYAYFDEVDNDKLKRFYLWRAFQTLQWYNVATFKDLKGMSTKLKLDFKVIADHYLQLAGQLLEKVEKIL